MAHSCPECGYTCHCGGDIDDCCFDGTPEQRRCTHCPIDGLDDDDPFVGSEADHAEWESLEAGDDDGPDEDDA